MKTDMALKTASLIICILIVTAVLTAHGQQKPAERTLANFEKNIDAGRLAEAERPLLQFAMANPNDARALELLGRLRLRQARVDEALSLYRKVLSLEPGFVTAKIYYGVALLMANQKETAQAVLQGIDEAEIKDVSVREKLAETLAFADEFRLSLDAIDPLPAAVKNGEALPVLALCYWRLGRTSDLTRLIPVAKRSLSTKPEAAIKFADILIRAGENDQAIEILRPVLNTSPRNATALVLLGKAEIGVKDFVQARTHLGRAATLEPRSAEVWTEQAELELAQGKPHDAVDVLKKASQLSPNSVEILARLALAAIKANEPRDGVDAAARLLELKPDDAEGLYLFGAASLQEGDLDKAQSALERFVKLRPKDTRGCLALGLTFAAERGQTEPARQQLRNCLEIDPGNAEARYQLGLSYKVLGDTAGAIKYLEDTIAVAPNYSLALRDLGAVYLQAGEEAKARTVLEKALSVDPNDADTHFQLSRLYNMTGETALAKRHLDIFQKLKNSGGRPIQ